MSESDSHSSTRPRDHNRFFALVAHLPASDRLLLHSLVAAVIGTGLWFVLTINSYVAEEVPVRGGTVVEGVVGTPRFVNPVLATTRADRDLTTLIFDGVMALDQDGDISPHLASDVTLSEDGTTYTITLRDDITWHDGEPLTAADVVFTYKLIQDPDIGSPHRGGWNSATIVSPGPQTVEITLPEPYQPFIENLTIGILPEHRWEAMPTGDIPLHVQNIEAVGSGPYRVTKVERNSTGRITQYDLAAHPGSVTQSRLDGLSVRFFSDTDAVRAALTANTISSTADVSTQYLDQYREGDYQVITTPLPRVFGIFFNQNRNPALRNQAARQALSLSLDRTAITEAATHGYGIPTTLAVPSDFRTVELPDVSPHPTTTSDMPAAVALLEDDGWVKNEDGLYEREIDGETVTLSVTLRAPFTELYDAAANVVVDAWETLGVEVRLEQYEQDDLLEGIVRPREFEAVLFGIDIGHSVDLYPFWHSSQQVDPGLNLTQYTNISTDEQLDTLRQSTDTESITAARQAVLKTLAEEVPAIFLFAPTANHIVHRDVTITPLPRLLETSDRLHTLTTWHRQTDTLWPIFHTNDSVITGRYRYNN